MGTVKITCDPVYNKFITYGILLMFEFLGIIYLTPHKQVLKTGIRFKFIAFS